MSWLILVFAFILAVVGFILIFADKPKGYSFFAFLFSLFAFVVGIGLIPFNPDDIIPSPPRFSFGNIVNNGYVAIDNDIIYYLDIDNSNLYRERLDGTGKECILNSNIRFLNVWNGFLYYSNADNNGYIYKMSLDELEPILLLEDNAYFLYVAGDWIYYVNYDGLTNNIYKVKVNGESRVKLNDDKSSFMNVSGKWIYYSNLSDNGYIYRIDTNGKNKQQLNSEPSHYINVSDSWIIYRSSLDESLFKIAVDKAGFSEPQQILNDKCSSINIDEEWIYFIDKSYNDNLYKVRINGNNNKTIVAENKCFNYIYVVDNWIYYYNGDDNYKLYRVTKDGNNPHLVF